MKGSFLVILFCISLTACDWFYETPIGGNYVLRDGNPNYRSISKRYNGKNITAIDQQVVGIKRRGRYVLVHRMVAISYECTNTAGTRSIMTKKTDHEEYWILDTKDSVELGPFDHSMLVTTALELNIRNVNIRQAVSYRPNVDYFQSSASNCIELEQISWGKGMRSPAELNCPVRCPQGSWVDESR